MKSGGQDTQQSNEIGFLHIYLIIVAGIVLSCMYYINFGHQFKTSVKTKNQVEKLKPHINQILLNEKWNFDLEDCDKILRIDSEENIVLEVIDLLNIHKFYCEELE